MKRRVLTILLFILLVSGGAIVNVAVAWSLAIAQKSQVLLTGIPLGGPGGPHWSGGTFYKPGACHVSGQAVPWGSFQEIHRPHWSVTARPPTDQDLALGRGVQEFARGWPMLSQYYRWNHTTRNVDDLEWGWQIVWLTGRRGQEEGNVLPLAVIWRGFAVNTVLYAIILWLLIPGPFALRRLIRMKRGRCPKCGYDLRGDPSGGAGCPECGWGRQISA